jgi:hypothetical protein
MGHYPIELWLCARCFKTVSASRHAILNLDNCCCTDAGSPDPAVEASQLDCPAYDRQLDKSGQAISPTTQAPTVSASNYRPSNHWKYVPLSPKQEIHVLDIDKGEAALLGSRKEADPIRGKLVPRDLPLTQGGLQPTDWVGYGALSYLWDGVESGPPIKIMKHTSSVLLHEEDNKLWARPVFHMAVWIDNLCFSQEDKDEKPAQISKIHEVYGEAKGAYTSLGGGNLLKIGERPVCQPLSIRTAVQPAQAMEDQESGAIQGLPSSTSCPAREGKINSEQDPLGIELETQKPGIQNNHQFNERPIRK